MISCTHRHAVACRKQNLLFYVDNEDSAVLNLGYVYDVYAYFNVEFLLFISFAADSAKALYVLLN